MEPVVALPATSARPPPTSAALSTDGVAIALITVVCFSRPLPGFPAKEKDDAED